MHSCYKVSLHPVDFPRIPEPAPRSAHPPSDIELMLRDYHQAREEAKVEIAKAQDRLRQRTEQEKLKIRQQIISQLLKVRNEAILCFRNRPGTWADPNYILAACESGYTWRV